MFLDVYCYFQIIFLYLTLAIWSSIIELPIFRVWLLWCWFKASIFNSKVHQNFAFEVILSCELFFPLNCNDIFVYSPRRAEVRCKDIIIRRVSCYHSLVIKHGKVSQIITCNAYLYSIVAIYSPGFLQKFSTAWLNGFQWGTFVTLSYPLAYMLYFLCCG